MGSALGGINKGGLMEPRFKMGDKVWYATSGTTEKKLPCADCFGKRFLTVILGDDSKLPIPCENCSWSDESSWGYREPYPHGYVRHYEWSAKAEQRTIDGIEISNTKVEYRSSCGSGSYWRLDEDKIFLTEQEAISKAELMSIEHNNEELAKIATKEKPTRSWAWNLSYHRGCIKRAEKDIVYHTAKLNAGKVLKKESEEAKTV